MDEVERRKRAQPGLETKRGAVLAFVRSHPNCLTNEVAHGCAMTQVMARRNLLFLLDSQLVGRQMAFNTLHEYESRWLAEVL